MTLEKVDLPESSKGKWKIEKFVVDREDFRANLAGRGVPFGTYTKLSRNGRLVMTDTPAEMRDHTFAVYKAKGVCLINGLGIGMVLKAILKKPEVTKVIVVEIDQEVIDLVSQHYNDPRVCFVCCDALNYKPPKGIRFGMVWHDIWDDICADNLPEMEKLHRKYGGKTDWQGSWCRAECRRGR